MFDLTVCLLGHFSSISLLFFQALYLSFSNPVPPFLTQTIQCPFLSSFHPHIYCLSSLILSFFLPIPVDVPTLLSSVGGTFYPDRRDTLLRILDIDPTWRLHAVSDGERRRVQLAMGLLRPWTVLLLDEITVDLDLLSRKNFLEYLRTETEERGATVVYATHILDNLVGWPTYLVHMHLGRVKEWGSIEEFEGAGKKENEEGKGNVVTTHGWLRNSSLNDLVLRWLEEDLKERGPRHGVEGKGRTAEGVAEGIGGYGFEKRG